MELAHIELIYIGIIITLLAEIFIQAVYFKYSKAKTLKGVNGEKIAKYILEKNGLANVKIEHTTGILSDHYNSRDKSVRLSKRVFDNSTVASIAIAAHECGHAIQDKEGYFFLRLRDRLVPITNLVSRLGYFAVLLGFLFSFRNLVLIGIAFEFDVLIFELITLPVEINASRRALKELKENDLISPAEVNDSRFVLIAAANTYVASVATSFLQIMRLIFILKSADD